MLSLHACKTTLPLHSLTEFVARTERSLGSQGVFRTQSNEHAHRHFSRLHRLNMYCKLGTCRRHNIKLLVFLYCIDSEVASDFGCSGGREVEGDAGRHVQATLPEDLL